MKKVAPLLTALSTALLLVLPQTGAGADDGKPSRLAPPVACEPGKDCFLQQMADMSAGPAVSDPFCGTASYDGHTGLDIRLRSMVDVARGIQVLAMADGVVVGARDGEPDHVVRSQADMEAVAGRECGNGVVLDHGSGIVTQYCHLRNGSLRVSVGQKLVAGSVLGEVGASGMAQFPHVHAEMRINDKSVDILTGLAADGGCNATAVPGAPRLSQAFASALGNGDAVLVDSGISAVPPNQAQLMDEGAPAQPDAASPAMIGWAWFANLRKDDRVMVLLTWPDGRTTALQTGDPLDRNKADYVAFAGRKRSPAAGIYRLEIAVIRDGRPLRTWRSNHTVR
ncbi:MAG: M23 family metallopeptidase [Nitratireductor sp.]|nr:M23 family metallopeptidase [Nitratireductor sp.]MCB1455698.1 M23 family metallopeptidase [Nitratireductor sp.]